MACLNILEMFKGKKVKIDVAPKRGPGRPKKARLDLEARPSTGIEPSEAVGCDDMAVQVSELAGCSAAVEEPEAGGQLVAREIEQPEADGTLVAVETPEAAGLLALVTVEPLSGRKLTARESGQMGAEHGIKGAEYGKLGGRPRKSLSTAVHLQDGSEQLVLVEGGASNRLQLSHVRKRDDLFGIVAKLDICKMVEQHLPVFLKSGRSLSDLYYAILKETGRTVAVM